jgi:hypothetical protein
VFSQVARNLTSTHRKTDQRKIVQFELCHQLVQILGKSIVVVGGCGLAGPTKASSVIGNNAISCVQKNWQLLFPRGAAEWISMNKNHWFARAMVFIVEIDVAGVFFSDGNVWHQDSPYANVLMRLMGLLLNAVAYPTERTR